MSFPLTGVEYPVVLGVSFTDEAVGIGNNIITVGGARGAGGAARVSTTQRANDQVAFNRRRSTTRGEAPRSTRTAK